MLPYFEHDHVMITSRNSIINHEHYQFYKILFAPVQRQMSKIWMSEEDYLDIIRWKT